MSAPLTEKGIRAKCRRKLKAIQRQVTQMAEDIAYDWGDVDQSIVGSCDEMIASVAAISEEIEAYMTERVDEAEASDEPEAIIDASKKYVSIDTVAELGQVSRKHVRRQVTRAQAGRAWCGAEMRAVIPSGGDVLIEFGTLPEHIREAFVMLDQADLPI
jgi:predicted DNA-binding protein (UPF0251 family)